MFGAEFETKVNPPSGTWIAVKFANLIDPALLTDVYSETPWLFSPMLCSMNIVNVQKDNISPASALVEYLENQSTSPISSKFPLNEVSRASHQVKSKPSPTEILGEWLWGGESELEENNAGLFEKTEPSFYSDNIAERRKLFQKQKVRQIETFKPDRVYHLEVCLSSRITI